MVYITIYEKLLLKWCHIITEEKVHMSQVLFYFLLYWFWFLPILIPIKAYLMHNIKLLALGKSTWLQFCLMITVGSRLAILTIPIKWVNLDYLITSAKWLQPYHAGMLVLMVSWNFYLWNQTVWDISETTLFPLKGNFYQVSSETLKKCHGIIVKKLNTLVLLHWNLKWKMFSRQMKHRL